MNQLEDLRGGRQTIQFGKLVIPPGERRINNELLLMISRKFVVAFLRAICFLLLLVT